MNKSISTFLVVGAGRGGTSLLAACLKGHRKITIEMEKSCWSLLMGINLATADRSRIFDERAGAFREACIRQAEKSPTEFWGNKITTEHLFALEDHNAFNRPYRDLITRFFDETLPDFKIIFILRDGRACAASKVNRTGQSWELAAYRWHYSVQVCKVVRGLKRETLVVKFEDLVTDPVRELSRVTGYMGLDFDENMLSGTRDTSILPEYRNDGFDVTKTRVPLIPAHVLEFLKPDLEYCGYI